VALVAGCCMLGDFGCTPEYQVPVGAGWYIWPDFSNLRNDEFELVRDEPGAPDIVSIELQGILEVWRGDDVVAGRTHDRYFVLSADRGLLFCEDGRRKVWAPPALAMLELFGDCGAWRQRLGQLGHDDIVLRPPRAWDSPGVRNAVYAFTGGACAGLLLGTMSAGMVAVAWRRWRRVAAATSGGSP
jgi:hypothetical protein